MQILLPSSNDSPSKMFSKYIKNCAYVQHSASNPQIIQGLSTKSVLKMYLTFESSDEICLKTPLTLLLPNINIEVTIFLEVSKKGVIYRDIQRDIKNWRIEWS